MYKWTDIEECPQAMKNYSIYVRAINSLQIRQTDCKYTYDYMIKHLDYVINLIMNLTSLDMFEIIIRLDKSGLENTQRYLIKNWNTSNVKIYDKRQIEQTLKYLLTK